MTRLKLSEDSLGGNSFLKAITEIPSLPLGCQDESIRMAFRNLQFFGGTLR